MVRPASSIGFVHDFSEGALIEIDPSNFDHVALCCSHFAVKLFQFFFPFHFENSKEYVWPQKFFMR